MGKENTIDLQEEKQREQLYEDIFNAALEKINCALQSPQKDGNLEITHQNVLVSAKQPSEKLFIEKAQWQLSNGKKSYFLIIQSIINSLAVGSQINGFRIAFDTNEQGKFAGLNTALSQPDIYFDLGKLTNLLAAIRTWSNKA